MNSLTQSCMFKERLKCEPIHLDGFVVDLRERHSEYWAPYSDTDPLERNSDRLSLMVRPPFEAPSL